MRDGYFDSTLFQEGDLVVHKPSLVQGKDKLIPYGTKGIIRWAGVRLTYLGPVWTYTTDDASPIYKVEWLDVDIDLNNVPFNFSITEMDGYVVVTMCAAELELVEAAPDRPSTPKKEIALPSGMILDTRPTKITNTERPGPWFW